jgi:SAM-dependent methyltransferase
MRKGESGMATQVIDQAKTEAFMGKALTDATGLLVTVMANIGDQLGLFKALVDEPATSVELATRADVNERYAREWLSAMASAGYLEYDPPSGRFSLPPEHAPVLVQDGGPFFLGGINQEIIGLVGPLKQVVHAFRHGGGVPYSAYDYGTWEGLERLTNGGYENALIPVWLPAMPEIQRRLEEGALMADIGSGHGRALIKLAQAFPRSRFVGYDVFAPFVARATANAQAAGVADRVRFEHLDATEGLPESYDIISTFDVIHDAINPRKLLRAIHDSLRPDGRYICQETNCSDKIEENAGTLGAALYSVSVLYCMTTSLAGHGEGLGTMGLPEPKLRELCAEAGFSDVRRLPIEDPFNNLYEIKP